MRRGADELKKDLIKFKGAREVGYILHLHSTREICRCCAVSLSQDLVHGPLAMEVTRISLKRNSENKIDPFFLLLTSSSQKLTNIVSHDEKVYARQGIGEMNVLKPNKHDDQAVDIEHIIHKKLFLQKIFVNKDK